MYIRNTCAYILKTEKNVPLTDKRALVEISYNEALVG